MAEENVTEQVSTGTPTQVEEVSLYDASDDDLLAFLNNPPEEGEYIEEEPEDIDDEAIGEQPELAAPTPPVTPAAQPAEQAKPETQSDGADSIQVSKAEWEKVKQQLESQEKFIHRRNAEIGELRKQKRELTTQLKSGLDDLTLENPLEAFERKQQIKELDKEIDSLDKEEKRMVEIHESQKILADTLKPEEADMGAMAAVLKRDGLSDAVINRFMTNPLDVTHVDTIIQLAKRARAENIANAIAHHASNKIKELTDEVESLRKQLNSAPKTILSGVQQALKTKPMVTASGGSSSRTNANLNPAIMSDDELEALLQSPG